MLNDIFILSPLQGIGLVLATQLLFVFLIYRQQRQLRSQTENLEANNVKAFTDLLHQLHIQMNDTIQLSQQRVLEKLAGDQLATHQLINQTVQKQMMDVREQINHSFKQHADSLTNHLQSLTAETRNHLQNMTQQVNTRLTEGFEKTSSTFTDIVKRLTIIDEAQKKITELSSHVVNLQDVLVDKRARGAFGEVQLATLIGNMIPATHYRMQHTLSNQKRADCILFLPEPSGHIVIDAKFPLETYQKLMNQPESNDKKTLQQQFRQDVQKHIKDIAEKYIIANETTDSAIMFIPAEAIFAEIHANYPELITLSQRLKVWLVSPSTLMAVLTTARAVLKDDATRKQVHIIQQHLQSLADDFQRFEKRMDKLAKHIDQAHQDVGEVSTSAKKITQRFQKIESVELVTEQKSLS
ncbi:DNA recombination protein RmuC [Legionella dresdenensis]|uniref:DNA recombination protein RmuC n=1 Tax=Legionella dresdenensis TaxID=450200 RepID=A0ABV8CHU2_9GAMM